METIPQPPAPARNQSTGMFGTKIPSTVTFAVGILLFLLPFAEIKCNDTVLTNKSGLNFAMGKEWTTVNNMNGDETKDVNTKTNSEKEGNAQYFAIAALALGVLGLLFSFGNAKSGGSAGILTGILSAGALIGLMFEVKKWFNAGLAKEAAEKANNGGEDTFGLNKLGNTFSDSFHLSFTPWFYVSLIAFLAAAFFSYQRMKANK